MLSNSFPSERWSHHSLAPKLRSLFSVFKTHRLRPKALRRFSTVLMATIVALVTLSVLVVLIVLNRYFNERVEEEFRKKLRAQKGQIEILMQNRITDIQKAIKDFSSDNTVRVTMMLDAKIKLADHVIQSYPPNNGVYRFIQQKESWSIFPQSYGGLSKELVLYAFYGHPWGDILQDGSKPRLIWLFSRSIPGPEGDMGTAAVLYDMAEDKMLQNSISTAVEGNLTLSYSDMLISLRSNRPYPLNPKRLEAEADETQVFTLMEDLAYSRVLGNRHLYYISPSKNLIAERRKVALLMGVFSAFVLAVTMLLSAFLAGKMIRPLKEMTRKAIQISEGNDIPLSFERKNAYYWEFDQLSQAFNTMFAHLKDAEERSRYKELLENVDDAVYILDEQGSIIEANAAAYTSLGYPREQFYNLQLEDVVPSEESRAILRHGSAAINRVHSQKMTLETNHRTRDGRSIPVEIHSRPIVYMGKSVILNVARDISDRLQIEKEKEYLETQLNHAQKMEAMGTMAGCIAHDFNNLIMGVQGRLDMMLMQLDPEQPTYAHAEAINKTMQSATSLTSQLLGFARKGKSELMPLNINTLVEESTRIFISARKEVTLNLIFADEIGLVNGDRGQLEQVLVNLYLNAWQAMPGGGDLNIHTRNTYLEDSFCKPFKIPGGDYVNIRISDTGVGMSHAIMDKIFDPFFTTKESGKGTGLGLASAYGIIRNHKGIITVKSEIGKGTDFDIYLPVLELEHPVKSKGSDSEFPLG